MAEWFSMGGRAGFVWSSYALVAVVLIGTCWWAHNRLSDAQRRTERLAKSASVDKSDTSKV